MGITGLSSLFKHTKNLNFLERLIAAVDAYCWLYKDASLFAEDVVIRNDNKKCIEPCAAYLDVLEENNVTAVVVMIGRKLEEKIVNENQAKYDLQAFESCSSCYRNFQIKICSFEE
ncbi:Hypothetical predicted protein [Paramuricea clavata]|uniref:Uncharacterized protein n=1 Tax=Paramuricea clavata TaxID=317549 RepID=A0A6S7I5Y1_PARCT|nr:Hypothetical predicted protein [Paramuricea clavata]